MFFNIFIITLLITNINLQFVDYILHLEMYRLTEIKTPFNTKKRKIFVDTKRSQEERKKVEREREREK